MAKSNSGIQLDPEKPKYSRGRTLKHEALQRLYDGIDVGLHPEVAAARVGWLPDEFNELVGRNEKLRRAILKRFAQYEYKRAVHVDAAPDPKTALAYLERCRSHWSRKIDVNLKSHAKKAFEKLEHELNGPLKGQMISREQAYDIVLMCFNAEGAEQVFE